MTYDKNNIFAKIIRGEIPSNKVYEDENILAFWDIFKASPIHVLVVPKGEYIDFNHFTENNNPEKIGSFFTTVSKIARDLDPKNEGFRLITNIGSNSHQTVKHFHVHILGGKKLGPLISSDNQLR